LVASGIAARMVTAPREISLKPQPVVLTKLSAAVEAVVVHVDDSVAGRLSGFGLYPGARLRIQQRFPSLVIKTDETEIALERRVASLVTVTPLTGTREGSESP
jgi:Fe2+ transport system protein FeoA